MDSDIVVETADGPMAAILAAPAGAGPFDAAIMLPHVGGLTRTMRRMAQRVAEGGYLCLVPELYHRLGTIVIDPESTNADVLAIRRIAAGSLSGGAVMADVRSALDWLDRQSLARRAPRGVIGYGASGGLALLAAGTFPEEIKVAASVLGFGFVSERPDSPHLKLAGVRAALYFAFAEHDEIIAPTVRAALQAALAAQGVGADIVVHPGARHPYAFPDRKVHDRDAAEADWTRIFALFERHLRTGR